MSKPSRTYNLFCAICGQFVAFDQIAFNSQGFIVHKDCLSDKARSAGIVPKAAG